MPSATLELNRNPWVLQRVVRSSWAVGSKNQTSEALLGGFLRDSSLLPNSVLGAMFEQSSEHARINPLDFIREHFREDVRRHEAG